MLLLIFFTTLHCANYHRKPKLGKLGYLCHNRWTFYSINGFIELSLNRISIYSELDLLCKAIEYPKWRYTIYSLAIFSFQLQDEQIRFIKNYPTSTFI